MKTLISALRRDATCRQQFLWRCDLLIAPLLESLDVEMQRSLFIPVAGPTVLVQWRHRESEHAILYVPATGRVQVRLDAFTPLAERAASALAVFAVLSVAVEAATVEVEAGAA